MAEPLVLSNGECHELDCEQGSYDHPELRWISSRQVGTRRWSIEHEVIVERLTDNTFWSGIYQTGATELQENDAWDDYTVKFKQVVPREKTVTVYVPIAA